MFCVQPASAAPRLSASTAGPDSEPKLIAEKFTTESWRKAPGRRRAAPSTLAQGTHASWPAVGVEGGATRANVACLTIGYDGVCSMSLSVPNPK